MPWIHRQQREFWKLLKKINREMGVTILLITHQMQVVQMICNKVAVMEKGQVVEAGSVLDGSEKPQAPVTKRFVQTVVNDPDPRKHHKSCKKSRKRTFPCRTTEIYRKQRKTPGYLRYLSCRRNCSKYLRSNRSRTSRTT